MLDFLTKEHDKIHEKGSFEGIGPGCRFVLAISYMREYRGMRQMAFDYDVSVSTVCDSVKWFEQMILKSPDFQLENIKNEIQKLEETGIEIKTVIIDVEEQPIERPIKNQEESYSGKKKFHTTKNQIVIEKEKELLGRSI